MDKVVNLFDEEIKRYLTSLAREQLTEKESNGALKLLTLLPT